MLPAVSCILRVPCSNTFTDAGQRQCVTHQFKSDIWRTDTQGNPKENVRDYVGQRRMEGEFHTIGCTKCMWYFQSF